MLPSSNCSTLATLIALPWYPSIPSCVVIATGDYFSTMIRLVFAANALGNATHVSVAISNGTSSGASVADLFTCCCPLPLAGDDADFTGSLFPEFRSSLVGVSLNSSTVDAAGFGAGAACVTPQPTPH